MLLPTLPNQVCWGSPHRRRMKECGLLELYQKEEFWAVEKHPPEPFGHCGSLFQIQLHSIMHYVVRCPVQVLCSHYTSCTILSIPRPGNLGSRLGNQQWTSQLRSDGHFPPYNMFCLLFYVLATSKVISEWVPTHGVFIVQTRSPEPWPDIPLSHVTLTLSQPVIPYPNNANTRLASDKYKFVSHLFVSTRVRTHEVRIPLISQNGRQAFYSFGHFVWSHTPQLPGFQVSILVNILPEFVTGEFYTEHLATLYNGIYW